jgi:aryl-alcohol dehydrogenase-like predicted oxidoreductase
MQLRRLGSGGPQVSALGLGCMGMSGMYGGADRATSIATIHGALERAVPAGAAAGDRYPEPQMAILDSERA